MKGGSKDSCSCKQLEEIRVQQIQLLQQENAILRSEVEELRRKNRRNVNRVMTLEESLDMMANLIKTTLESLEPNESKKALTVLLANLQSATAQDYSTTSKDAAAMTLSPRPRCSGKEDGSCCCKISRGAASCATRTSSMTLSPVSNDMKSHHKVGQLGVGDPSHRRDYSDSQRLTDCDTMRLMSGESDEDLSSPGRRDTSRSRRDTSRSRRDTSRSRRDTSRSRRDTPGSLRVRSHITPRSPLSAPQLPAHIPVTDKLGYQAQETPATTERLLSSGKSKASHSYERPPFVERVRLSPESPKGEVRHEALGRHEAMGRHEALGRHEATLKHDTLSRSDNGPKQETLSRYDSSSTRVVGESSRVLSDNSRLMAEKVRLMAEKRMAVEDRLTSEANRDWHYQETAPAGHYQETSPLDHYQDTSPSGHYQEISPVSVYQEASPVSHYQEASPMNHYQETSPAVHYQETAPVPSYQEAHSVASYQETVPVSDYQDSGPVAHYQEPPQYQDCAHYQEPAQYQERAHYSDSAHYSESAHYQEPAHYQSHQEGSVAGHADNAPSELSVYSASHPRVPETRPPIMETRPPMMEARPLGVEARPVGVETRPVGVETRPVGVETRLVGVEARSGQGVTPPARKTFTIPTLRLENVGSSAWMSGHVTSGDTYQP